MHNPIKWLIRITVIILATIGIVYLLQLHFYKGGIPVGKNTKISSAKIGGPFKLVDHFGNSVTDQDFDGKFLIVFFGFTYCPDICPMTIYEITETLRLLKRKANKVQAIFISVDPDRDKPQILKEYLSAFDPRIIGLTGTPSQIKDVTRAYKI